MEVAVKPKTKDRLRQSLHKYFGFDSFKGSQEQIIRNVLDGKDTFVLMPTGGGKSLCYQLPAMISEGTAIIISPLIALMKNQVDLVRSYSSLDSVAHFLNSSLNKVQIKEVREDILSGSTKLLYVAPETLNKRENLEFFRGIKVSFLAVDEAHCISEWGHDFRPEYRKIRQMINSIGGNIPIVALTATATPKVRSDILKNLQMRDPGVFISSFNRPNLYYEVRPKGKKEAVIKNIIRFIKGHEGKSGIIYCLSRKTTEELAEVLRVNGIGAEAYHAGLDAATRAKRQDLFLMDDLQVIVATIAFGLGIDKPDIRFVIHYNIPRSLEGYYQETGRAGRDGLEGHCVAYYNFSDILKLEKFLRDKPVSEREIGAQLLMEVSAYAENSVCRRKFLLHYFGENYDKDNCDSCDNCKNPKELVEGKAHTELALRTILAVNEKFDILHVVNVLLGKKSQKVAVYSHQQLGVFGQGQGDNESFWNAVIRKALLEGLLEKDIENYGLLKLSEAGHKFLSKPYSVLLSRNHDFEMVMDEEDAGPQRSALDPILLNLLKDLRKKLSRDLQIPPFVIFQDSSLEDMSTQYPVTMEELTHITGVSLGKAQRYGKKFLGLIKNYVEENDIDRPTDMVVKSVIRKSGDKVFIIQNIDKKIPLEDIARSRAISMGELLNELESIVNAGTRVNIGYYVNDVLDEEQQDIIYDYFRTATTDSLHEAAQAMKEYGFDLPNIQMMRIKFMSEMAN